MEPKSENIARVESNQFYITAGMWRNGYGETYEIGIRDKLTNRFTLIQRNWNLKSVVKAANAFKILLDAAFTEEDIEDILSN